MTVTFAMIIINFGYRSSIYITKKTRILLLMGDISTGLTLCCTSLYDFPGGHDYTHIISNLYQLDDVRKPILVSYERTTILTDNVMDSFLNITHHSRRNLLWAKILPSRFYLLGKILIVLVAGRHFSRSPVNGLSVSVQPTCNGNWDCENAAKCKAKLLPVKAGMFLCEYRCKIPSASDFVAVYINNNAVTLEATELCEIWFSNWLIYAQPYKDI